MIDALLSRLTRVRGRAPSWTACCPAHEDRSPSLSIREEAGKILLHCHGGCSVEQVVGSVGMTMEDLFPPRPDAYVTQHKRVRLFPGDVLRAIEREALIVSICAHDMGKGKTLPQADRDRLITAYQRISAALEACNG